MVRHGGHSWLRKLGYNLLRDTSRGFAASVLLPFLFF